MKIELSNHDFSMFQKSEAFHSAEIYSNNGEYITIALIKGSKQPTTVGHITLNRGELLACLNFESHA